MGTSQSSIACEQVNSHLGWITITASEKGLRSVQLGQSPMSSILPNPITALAKAQLTAYFDKQLTQFDVPLDAVGTAFQHRVWCALQTIKFGQTASYGSIAQYIGKPTAARAVGMANGKNPIAIIVPCHRIIGANQRLTGYAGGLDKKSWLLTHEGVPHLCP